MSGQQSRRRFVRTLSPLNRLHPGIRRPLFQLARAGSLFRLGLVAAQLGVRDDFFPRDRLFPFVCHCFSLSLASELTKTCGCLPAGLHCARPVPGTSSSLAVLRNQPGRPVTATSVQPEAAKPGECPRIHRSRNPEIFTRSIQSIRAESSLPSLDGAGCPMDVDFTIFRDSDAADLDRNSLAHMNGRL